ncbi:MAG: 50S ribosomal protein L6 [Chloroflexi bacterium]|nr:50S ribosomal protein L6 [Chloroflexota bacterium]
MSRVGKVPIEVPAGVEVRVEGGACSVRGPRGELAHEYHPDIEVRIEDGVVTVGRHSDAPPHRALHGLTRSLIANMVEGVTDGFTKTLEIVGTGYRAELRGENLVLTVGFSHPVELHPIAGAAFVVETPIIVHITGIDKQIVGQQAAIVRHVRKPEPYQGKGIRYRGEVVRRKAGKRG